MDKFKFNCGDKVELVDSGEQGTVIGRAEYTYCDPSFFVRYKCGDGRLVESWWTETAILKTL